jgi:hypothetical protein
MTMLSMKTLNSLIADLRDELLANWVALSRKAFVPVSRKGQGRELTQINGAGAEISRKASL